LSDKRLLGSGGERIRPEDIHVTARPQKVNAAILRKIGAIQPGEACPDRTAVSISCDRPIGIDVMNVLNQAILERLQSFTHITFPGGRLVADVGRCEGHAKDIVPDAATLRNPPPAIRFSTELSAGEIAQKLEESTTAIGTKFRTLARQHS